MRIVRPGISQPTCPAGQESDPGWLRRSSIAIDTNQRSSNLDALLPASYTSRMPILPLPMHVEQRPGQFRLTADTIILAEPANRWNADYLHDLLTASTGFPMTVQVSEQTARNAIRLRLDSQLESLGPEGYRLEVLPEAVSIAAPTTTGVFYGLQSLRQLLPASVEERRPVTGVDWQIDCLEISDRPRFSWRGFMLDEGRHFHGLQTVLLTLDLMALQKLNVLHWHLTEDQGWRIAINKYPKLTEIGSHRPGTRNAFSGNKHNGIPHGGFYTQEEIRLVVAYAADRHITVVPEVEMPGHCMAALAAYPELSCTGGPFEVATHFGVYTDIYCAGKEAVFTFMEAVLEEVLQLFPSPYIHIGGDEAPKQRWKKCPDCQRRIRAERLKDEHALQVYFMNRIAAWLESKGRHIMGWNEILQPGLTRGALVQFWWGDRGQLLKAIRNDQRITVMSNFLDTYLDHSYSLMPLSRAYRYEPVPAGLDETQSASILGLEFPLWTEWVPDRARLEYQAYPRLTAMAETGWTPRDRKDLPDFLRRLKRFLERLERLGVRHAPLRDVEPSRFRQAIGLLSISQPQTRTADDPGRPGELEIYA